MEDLPLDQFVTYRLLRLTNQLNRQAVRLLAQNTGLRLPEWRCLAIIDAYGPQQVNQIAGRLSADKGLVSRSLAALEGAGYIRMERSAQDRRNVTASLAPRGEEAVARMMPIMRRRQEVLLGVLSPGEREELYRQIDKLHEAAKAFENELAMDETG